MDSSTFSFIQITDHHLREHETDLTFGFSTAHAFRATLRHLAQHAPPPDFLLTTGVLVNTGTDAEYQAVRAMLGLRDFSPAPGPQRVKSEGLHDMPMYFLPGNHDPRDVFFRNMFPDDIAPGASVPPGASPRLMNVVFTHKGIRFICIDWGDVNKPIAYPAMLEFLTQSVRDRSPAILLMHHALAPVGIPRLDSFLPDDVPGFADIVRGSSVLAIFCGHFHTTYETAIAGIPVYGLRSTTFSFAPDGDKMLFVLRPPHYRVVTVTDNTVTTEIVEVPL